MAIGKDLLNVALVVGGGYIIIYHVLPALQSGQIPGFAPRGTFLPPAAAAPGTGQTKCWPIGNGKNACACAGKQWFQMGELRPCDDCYTHCAGGTPPDRRRPTSAPVPPKQTGTGIPRPVTPSGPASNYQIFSANCYRDTRGHYCWNSSGKTVCTPVASCTAARSAWLAKYGSGPATSPTARPIAPHLSTGVTPTRGTRCVATATGFGSTKVWDCTFPTGRKVRQGVGWRCNGRTASEMPNNAWCTPAG